MSNIISDIKEKINQKINKGILINWNNIYQDLVLNEAEGYIIETMQKWYKLIFEQSFLYQLPVGAEEIFFHSSLETQINLGDCKEDFYHDINEEDFPLLLSVICLQNQQQWNYSKPFTSFYFKNKNYHFRMSLVHGCINANQSPKAFLRILNNKTIPLESYKHSGLLNTSIEKRKNIIIAGSTGSGKTTLINSLLSSTNSQDHLLILEDTYELISPNEKTTRLLSGEEENRSMDAILAYSLRMSPDRIILGELRSTEVTTFIQAMNTGHKGMLTTIHANSASDALTRIALLFSLYSGTNLSFELTLKLVCQNIDQVVFIKDKSIEEIIDVYGSEKSQIFFDAAS